MDPTPHVGKSPSFSLNPKSIEAPEIGSSALTPGALRQWLQARGAPAFRARQVLSWLYRRRAASFREMTDLPAALRLQLEQEFTVVHPARVQVRESRDGTRKLLLVFADGVAVESVLIPDRHRLTLCLSSQAGCGMGCRFCATARLGLRRNLNAAEILAQVLAAFEQLGPEERLTNVVFMGMGEPLANYDHLREALEVLQAEWGFGISGRRITVSTVGLLPQMLRLVRETPVQLAVSLTGTTEEQRSRLMPINRRYSLRELLATCRELPLPQRRRITFEYVLLAGENDSLADADRLARLLRGVRAKVNLIPFNPFPGAGYERPSEAAVRAFQERLFQHGLLATVRRSRGLDVQAACGQLALAERSERTASAAADPR